jgi:hypothetical protein
VGSWSNLTLLVEECPDKCAFELVLNFECPTEGFRSIEVMASVSIYGRGVAVIDAHGQDQMFFVRSGGTPIIEGVAMQNGVSRSNGGAVACANGNYALTNCMLTNNTASSSSSNYSGGAVSGNGPITNCTFTNNTASSWSSSYGGAVSVSGNGGPITNCTFTNNTVSSGSSSSDSSASSSGGAVYGGGPITNFMFTNNTASSPRSSSRSVDGLTASSGGAVSGGGPITNCTFANNAVSTKNYRTESAPVGSASGGAASGGGPITNCMFTNNTASSYSSYGGAVSLSGTSPLTDCTFIDNDVHGVNMSGSALYMKANSFVQITGCEFLQPTTASKGNNDIARYTDVAPRGLVSFDCAANTTGKPVIMMPNELPVTQLPPQQQIVHCTPSALIPKQEN